LYLFCSILSFGAPQSNTYKIIAEGRGEMVFETSQVIINNYKDNL
jgi:hypothetical protein